MKNFEVGQIWLTRGGNLAVIKKVGPDPPFDAQWVVQFDLYRSLDKIKSGERYNSDLARENGTASNSPTVIHSNDLICLYVSPESPPSIAEGFEI